MPLLDGRPRDAAMVAFASKQHNVLALSDLLRFGLTARAIRARAAAGRLHRIHRGVYAVGRPGLGIEGLWMAAVLAYGPMAVLSHRSAAALWGLLRSTARPIDVTVPVASGHGRKGIRLHRSTTLTQGDVTVVDNIPCTTVARTLVDFADIATRRELERAMDQAEALQLFDLTAISEVLDRSRGRRGAPIVRAVLADHAVGETLTREDLEELFFLLCSSSNLPPPRINEPVPLPGEQITPDFHWPRQKLAVELDSWRHHAHRRAFEEDRRRAQVLTAAGWTALAFTWRQVQHEPERVAAAIRAALERGEPGI